MLATSNASNASNFNLAGRHQKQQYCFHKYTATYTNHSLCNYDLKRNILESKILQNQIWLKWTFNA